MKLLRFLGYMAVVAALTGCGQAIMNVEDAVVAPGQAASFVVSVDREYFKPSVAGANVSVWINGMHIGQATTDSDGNATVRANVDPGVSSYQAQATIDGKPIRGQGRIFHWNPGRTAIAVDVDDTISHTNYSDLFVSQFDTSSAPFEHSPQVLRAIARNYQIVYVSARPRWLLEKSRAWLDRNGFPPGPILHAPGFDACFRQAYYKEKIMAEFQRQFPNLLAGVGDKMDDDQAYWGRKMLAVILGRSNGSYRNHCIVVPNWEAVGEFFKEHSDSLADANRLSDLIQTSSMNLRPMFAIANTPSLASGSSNGQALPTADR